jgi:4a-hydroxytetrahydrobiopterin dehydratase
MLDLDILGYIFLEPFMLNRHKLLRKKMTELSQMNCVSIKSGDTTLPASEVERYLQQVPEWQLVSENGEQRLKRVFRFKNFAEALAFTNRVGQIAEQQDHHPALLTEWGRVTVSWWTHKVHGLHLNDFIMAARTDRL